MVQYKTKILLDLGAYTFKGVDLQERIKLLLRFIIHFWGVVVSIVRENVTGLSFMGAHGKGLPSLIDIVYFLKGVEHLFLGLDYDVFLWVENVNEWLSLYLMILRVLVAEVDALRNRHRHCAILHLLFPALRMHAAV